MASVRVGIFVATVASALSAGASVAAQPLARGLVDASGILTGSQAGLALAHARSAGVTAVRLGISWRGVAPERPASPSDPNDPTYEWSPIDAEVAAVVGAGMTPVVSITDVPAWATGANPGVGSNWKPDPAAFGAFTRAAVAHFDGTENAPRVRYWMAWVEPNLTPNLSPQLVGGKPFMPGWYRTMVNEFAASVHAVPGNYVIAGGLAPFRDITPVVYNVNKDWGPLSFMRSMLCLSSTLKTTCHTKVNFDIWSVHPYTSGGPTHKAQLPNDVSLGDLPKLRKTLRAAEAAGTIVSRGPVRLWVTEFSWDSKPPDPKGVPAVLEARWVAEALYRMWSNGVSLVMWFGLRDEPLAESYFQSGLYYRGTIVAKDRRKPMFESFRFPVVALPAKGGVRVWLRAPESGRQRVRLEQRVTGGWRPFAIVTTTSGGIFQRVFMLRGAAVRGVIVSTGERSRGFAVKGPPDHFYNPFGLSTLVVPKKK